MKWIDYTSEIPTDKKFYEIVADFLFQCPSCNTKNHSPVSKRGKTFYDRGINKGLLITLLNNIKRRINKSNYLIINTGDDVENKVDELVKNSRYADKNFEFIVLKKHPEISITESIYYYIRNALAHGSFEVIGTKNNRIYLLENSNKGKLTAMMRLKESTLKYIASLSKMSAKEIEKLRR
jgi:hypothetical protein